MDSADDLQRIGRVDDFSHGTATISRAADRLRSPCVRPSEGRSWDFRPFGQSLAVRKHRLERGYLRVNEWKVKDGLLSRKAAKKAAKRHAVRAVAADLNAGCKCAVRMGSRTWLATL